MYIYIYIIIIIIIIILYIYIILIIIIIIIIIILMIILLIIIIIICLKKEDHLGGTEKGGGSKPTVYNLPTFPLYENIYSSLGQTIEGSFLKNINCKFANPPFLVLPTTASVVFESFGMPAGCVMTSTKVGRPQHGLLLLYIYIYIYIYIIHRYIWRERER